MMLSVIIPTRNRARRLAAALESLCHQTLEPEHFEVLVIDNGSTDTTHEVVQSFVGRIRQLRYYYDATPGLHVGRHVGLREAVSDVLVYADDDIEATPTWLAAIQDCFHDPRVALVGGNNYPRFESSPPPWLDALWRQPSAFFKGQAITSLSILHLPDGRRPITPFAVWGCNFSVRKQVLLDAQGFHPDGVPEERIRFRGDGETHVCLHVMKSGLIAMFDSRASVYHAVPNSRMTFEYFRKRAFNQGISDSYTALRSAPPGGKSPHPVVRGLRAITRRVRARAKDLLTRDPQLRELNRIMREGYDEGYAFHQEAYASDSEVRAWVHRPNYF
jgi:glycosyltransferase involved in cell wall biosynthesis